MASLGSLHEATPGRDAAPSILGRGPDGAMWVRARVADPSVAPVVGIPDATDLLRVLREGQVHAGPILAPLTAGALAGTARAIASMDVQARTNASSAIAGLIGRTRPDSGAVRIALARSVSILRSGESGSRISGSLDRVADALAADLGQGSTLLAARLEAVSPASVLLAGTWSRQSLGDPWLVTELLSGRERTVAVARGGPTGEGDLVAGWVDPPMRSRLEVIEDVAVAAALRAGRCQAVLLLAEDVRRDGTVAASLGSLAVALIAQRYGIPVVGVDPVSTFVTRAVDAPGDGPAIRPEPNPVLVDLVPPALIAQTIDAR